MPTVNRRRTIRAAALMVSATAHVTLLIALVLWKTVLIIPDEPAGPPEAIIPILLLPRTPPAVAGGAQQGQLQLHRRAPRFAPVPPPAAPVTTAAALAAAPPAAPNAAPPWPTAESRPGLAPTADLRAALRHGAVGCANRASLSRTERDLCDERFAKGVAAEAFIPAPLNPLKRAHYDAVVEAKKPDGQPVPQQPPGSLGMFDADHRGRTGHPPAIGCRVPFGPGKKPKLPSNWLTLGPCYIAPPQGPLTVEADITPP